MEQIDEDSSDDFQSVTDLTDTGTYRRGLGPTRTSSGNIYYETAEEEFENDCQMAKNSAATENSNCPTKFLQSLTAPLFSYDVPKIVVSSPDSPSEDEDISNNNLHSSISIDNIQVSEIIIDYLSSQENIPSLNDDADQKAERKWILFKTLSGIVLPITLTLVILIIFGKSLT